MRSWLVSIHLMAAAAAASIAIGTASAQPLIRGPYPPFPSVKPAVEVTPAAADPDAAVMAVTPAAKPTAAMAAEPSSALPRHKPAIKRAVAKTAQATPTPNKEPAKPPQAKAGAQTETKAEPKTAAEPVLPVITETDQQRFQEWLGKFSKTVAEVGIEDETVAAAFADIKLNPNVLAANNFQPEFSKSIWDYLDTAVSDVRVELGQQRFASFREDLTEVEQKYGVPGRYIVAIWGIETNYGSFTGNHDIFEALATLGFEGRRTGYGRSQLVSALKLAQAGHKPPKQMLSSWAGAVGHTQFIPSTYDRHAVDADGDGRKDLWDSLADVFASTANFLKNAGWQPGLDWGREVKIHKNFDFTLVDPEVRLSLKQWAAFGVTTPSGDPLPAVDVQARLLLPGGHRGPAFLAFDNFDVLLRYNASTSYAIAVGHLADRLSGGLDFAQSWPRQLRALSLEERKELQERLNARGFGAGEVDGIIGAQTRKAIQKFQAHAGLIPDGFPSSELLEKLRNPA